MTHTKEEAIKKGYIVVNTQYPNIGYKGPAVQKNAPRKIEVYTDRELELLEALRDIVEQAEKTKIMLPADLADSINIFGKQAIKNAK